MNRVMPQESQTLPSDQIYSNSDLPVEISELQSVGPRPIVSSVSTGTFNPVSASSDIIILPSASNSRSRLLRFIVQFGDRTIPVNLHDHETVGKESEMTCWSSTEVT